MKPRLFPVFLVVALLFIFSGLSLFYIYQENVSLDEGIYLYAANRVYEGQWLYADFIYPHLPTLPYVYGLGQKLGGAGILSGRFTSFTLYLLIILLTGAICYRHFSPAVALLAMFFLATKAFNLITLNLAFTYPLALFFFLGALSLGLEKKPRPVNYLSVTLLVCLAVSARLLVIVTLPLFWAYLWRGEKWRQNLIFIGLGLGIFLLLLWPFIIKSPANFWFDVYGQYVFKRDFHWREFLAARRHYLAGSLKYYWPELGLGLLFSVILARRWISQSDTWRQDLRQHSPLVFLAALLLMLWAATFLLPPFSYPLHNLIFAPLLAILSAWGLVRLKDNKRWLANLLLCGLALVWAYQNYARIAYDLSKGDNPFKQIKAAVELIQEYTKPTEKILTLATYLALESQRLVLPGLEQSGFTCLFDKPGEFCQKYRATSPALLNASVKSRLAGLVILSPAEFEHYQASALEELLRNLQTEYFLAAKVNVQAETLSLWLPNEKLATFAPLQEKVEYWQEIAGSLLKKGELAPARPFLTLIAALQPTAANYYRLALTQFNLQENHAALKSLEMVLKLQPDFPGALEKYTYLQAISTANDGS